MPSLLEGLAGAIGGQGVAQLASAFGTDNNQMGKAVAAALPMLLGAMTNNSRQSSGADSLFNAVAKDHDGSILDSLGEVFGGSKWAQQQSMSTGEKILGHVFGDSRPRVEQQVQQSSGLNMGLVTKLLPILAPVVMGYLGKMLSGGGMDSGGLAGALFQEDKQVRQQDSGLGGLLDMITGGGKNNDGGSDLMDIVTGPIGKSILSSLLK